MGLCRVGPSFTKDQLARRKICFYLDIVKIALTPPPGLKKNEKNSYYVLI